MNNMKEVRLPIETIKNGDTTIKVCVEDVYRLINRLYDVLYRLDISSEAVLKSIHKEYKDYEGELIIGKGVSKPCNGDVYNDEIGETVAFVKAKLNANIKKRRIIERLLKTLDKAKNEIKAEGTKLDNYIRMDEETLSNF